ncbi:MAG: type IV toxin-antitoxin system AbiEi family antitoxin domain-containing protein [Actinomycetia bacterium]|nr:type IV toxin-antitoxin system AbiEi family antitoxin domain-containing protein [Actinomycetes bacterium]
MSPQDLALAPLIATQHGAFTRLQALEVGFSDNQIKHRLRSGLWIREHAGVYRHHLVALTWTGRLMIPCLIRQTIASHRSAARLHGLDGSWGEAPEVSRPNLSGSEWPGVIVHRSTQWDRIDAIEIDGIPVTGIGRTLIDLAAVVRPHQLRQAIDDAFRKHLINRAGLDDVLDRHARRGRDGAGRLRDHLEKRRGDRPLPLSDWANLVADLLESGGLPRPVAEFRVTDGFGFVAYLDLAYPDQMVGIELDSKAWHFDAQAFEADPLRRNQLENLGWSIRNFTWSMYAKQPVMVQTTVAAALRHASKSVG